MVPVYIGHMDTQKVSFSSFYSQSNSQNLIPSPYIYLHSELPIPPKPFLGEAAHLKAHDIPLPHCHSCSEHDKYLFLLKMSKCRHRQFK